MNRRQATSNRPNLLIFAGGSGIRSIHIELAKSCEVTRIMPVSDNGGSSRALRQHFKLMPVGDIRHALMTAAYSAGCARGIIRLFNWRLPQQANPIELNRELNAFCDGRHVMVQPVSRAIQLAVREYLLAFKKQASGLRIDGGSVGNFILIGAYLVHGHINTAIAALSKLLGIRASVWPISLSNDLQLYAGMENDATIAGQAEITSIDRTLIVHKIVCLNYAATLQPPTINPLVADAIKHADMIVFGPGSFFTSVLPHLMIKETAEKIACRPIPKVFIANMLQGNECFGYNVRELLRLFLHVANKFCQKKLLAHAFVTNVMANQKLHDRYREKRYLEPGRGLAALRKRGIRLTIQDFEDPWRGGTHDAKLIAQNLLAVMQANS